MTWNGDPSTLRGGGMDAEYEATHGHNAGAITQQEAARIAIAILEDEHVTGGAPSTTPLESNGRSGIPAAYGKWGDLA